jgi:opacity protein-like surface antigen
MKRTVLGVVVAVLALTGSATVVHGQNPMTFGIAAGATFPTGDIGDGASTGFHGLVTLGAMPALVPFGVRIDGMYHSLDVEDFDDGVLTFTGNSLQILGLTANGVFSMPGMMVTSPYLIGGIGYYNTKLKSDDFDSDGESNFGLNIGIGAKFNLGGFGTFAEVRYHNIFDGDDDLDIGNTAFIPLTFGIMF